MALAEAAEALEDFARDHDGHYTRRVDLLTDAYGLTVPEGIRLTIPVINDRPDFSRAYCIEAEMEASAATYSFDDINGFSSEDCGNLWFGD